MVFKSDRQRKAVMARFRVVGRGLAPSPEIIGTFKTSKQAVSIAKRFKKQNEPVVSVTDIKKQKFIKRPF